MPRTVIELPPLRPHQQAVWDGMKRFNVCVMHRRAGKSYFAVLKLIEAVVAIKRSFPPPQTFYVGPTYKQTKRIAWLYVKAWGSMIPGAELNQSELKLTLPNGGTLTLLGAEDYDSLRGMYADAIVCDEAAMLPTSAWHEVLRPMLTDFKGWCLFSGTPMGMMNLLGEMAEHSKITPHWTYFDFKYTDTDVFDAEEIEEIKRDTPDAVFAQEYENSFTGAIQGSYFVKEMNEMIADGRFTEVTYDKAQPVYAAVDIGYGDLMIYTIFQQRGNNIDIIDCQQFNQLGIPDTHVELQQLAWKPQTLILPHDAQQHDVGTGKTRKHVWQQLGYEVIQLDRHLIADGIDATRNLLPRVYMDSERCKMLMQAMLHYHTEYDEVKRAFKQKPAHTWSSHYADSMRYLAMGENYLGGWGSINYEDLDRAAI